MQPSKQKAKKILEDGSIRGKELTDKQKRFFGWLANKKNFGGVLDPNGYLTSNIGNFTPYKVIPGDTITTDGMAFPIVANGKPLMPNTGEYQFPGSPYVVETPLSRMGVFRRGGTKYQMGGGTSVWQDPNLGATNIQGQFVQPDRFQLYSNYAQNPQDDRVYMADLINYSVRNRVDPLKTPYAGAVKKIGLDQRVRDIVDYISVFNNRRDVQGLTPDQRVELFYSLAPQNPRIVPYIGEYSTLGTSPLSFSRTLPPQGTMKSGGKYQHGVLPTDRNFNPTLPTETSITPSYRTPYPFTYATFQGGNGQGTMYFPGQQVLGDAMTNDFRTLSSSSGQGWGQGTGYVKKKGGKHNKPCFLCGGKYRGY